MTRSLHDKRGGHVLSDISTDNGEVGWTRGFRKCAKQWRARQMRRGARASIRYGMLECAEDVYEARHQYDDLREADFEDNYDDWLEYEPEPEYEEPESDDYWDYGYDYDDYYITRRCECCGQITRSY